MIDAKELRIGNWLEYLGKYVQANTSIIHAVSRIVHPSEMYNPIPLSSEILEKCGFKDNGVRIVGSNEVIEWMLGDYDAKIERDCTGKSLEYVLHSDEWGNIEKSIEVKYVHQLQNIHFALTNEELIYTP